MKYIFFSNPRRIFSVLIAILALAVALPQIVMGAPLKTATETTVIFLPFLSKPLPPMRNILVNSFGGNSDSLMVQNGFAYVGEGSRLTIVDVHNSAQPVRVASLPLPGVIKHIRVVGNLAYLAVTYGGLAIIDISQPDNPQQVSQFVSDGQARDITILGNYAYLSTSAALQIIDINVPSQPLLLGQYAVDARHTQVVGDLAYVDTGNGFQIVNVYDPHAPSLVGSYYSILGDLRQVNGDIAYVTISDCFMGSCHSELQTVSVNDPSVPTLLDRYQVSGSALEISSFQISGDLVFMGITRWLDIVNISDPTHMVLVGRYQSSSLAISPLQIMGNFAYIGGGLAMDVVDVSDPAHPSLVKTYTTTDPISSSVSILVNNNIYYRTIDLRGQLSGGFQIIDVSTPSNPTLAGKFITEIGYRANQVQVVNGLAYVVGGYPYSFYADTGLSLRVVDVHDIHNPKLLVNFAPESGGGIWDTWATVPAVQVINNTAYIITGFGKLEIVDMSNPISPTVLSDSGFGLYRGVQVVGDHAYVTYVADSANVDPQTGFYIVNISNPYSPTELSNYIGTQYGYINCLKVLNGLAYLGGTKLQIVNVENPINPTLVSTYTSEVSANITGMEVAGNWAYIAFEGGRLEIVNISDPANPTLAGSYTAPGTITGIKSSGNTIYIVVQGIEIQVIDVTVPTSPSSVYRYPTDAHFIQVTSDGIGYIAAGNSGVQIINP